MIVHRLFWPFDRIVRLDWHLSLWHSTHNAHSALDWATDWLTNWLTLRYTIWFPKMCWVSRDIISLLLGNIVKQFKQDETGCVNRLQYTPFIANLTLKLIKLALKIDVNTLKLLFRLRYQAIRCDTLKLSVKIRYYKTKKHTAISF